MPSAGGASSTHRSRSPRPTRRGHRGGAYVRSLGQLSAPATNWSWTDRAAEAAGEPIPEWLIRLRNGLSRLSPAEKVTAANRLETLAAALRVEAGEAN